MSPPFVLVEKLMVVGNNVIRPRKELTLPFPWLVILVKSLLVKGRVASTPFIVAMSMKILVFFTKVNVFDGFT
jgi:hypothetical protein